MSDFKRPYGDLIAVQKTLRGIAHTSKLDVELESDPEEPDDLDDLALVLAAVRTNLLLVEVALNEKDQNLNGPELRTRGMIKQDILADQRILERPMPNDPPRSREEIEANLRYDEFQLARSHFPGCD
ncbi:hypothetical protein [Streptomyces sp. 5-10]|uniref:hypothetical protein n=1 Tax=Streptomyces sp. 5-10 TaxID=878925 RepID=UPI00168C0388|nr:hypothetical protein [Streptomyces sp. 5-10]MBD3004885.1 hypothetical protein [Streptomyces sp. 5-10]